MIKHAITETYSLKWQIKFDNKYKISICKKIINTHTGRRLKECVNGYTIGFWFGKKFIPKTKINQYVELIPNNNLLF